MTYNVAMNPNRILWKKGDKMLVWLTANNLDKYKVRKCLHFHLVDRNAKNLYTHLGDWELEKRYAKRMIDFRRNVYYKCLVTKEKRDE